MIVTVTLNVALDVTYQLDQVDWNGVNRVQNLHRRAGGKGVNVARVLAALGHDVLVTGLAGGPTGHAVTLDLTAAALPHALTPVGGDSRTTLTVTGPAGTALFNEPGPQVTEEELARFLDGYDTALAGAAAVVISGSLPRGVPADIYATLAARAADRGIPALVDADGAALRHAPAGRPSIVKPNLEELSRAFPSLTDSAVTGPPPPEGVTEPPPSGISGPPTDDVTGPSSDGVARHDADAGVCGAGHGSGAGHHARAHDAHVRHDARAGCSGGGPERQAEAMREAGAQAVVVSMGYEGLVAVTAEGTWRARMPYRVAGNPTGAGDALVAGLAMGVVAGMPWPERLRLAAALGAAAVAMPTAGEIDHATFQAVQQQITVS